MHDPENHLMTHQPLVSVVISSYNNFNESYLRECFDSVVNQTYKNIELIIIDDGSADEASAILRKLQPVYHYKLEKQKNKGLSGGLNTGISKYAGGKYIAIMGSDDYWTPNKIEKQVDYFEAAPEDVAACCTGGYYVYMDNPARPTPRLARTLQQEEVSFKGLLLQNHILQMSVMMKREVLNEVGLFDEESYVEDWDMWLRIANRYKIGYLPDALCYYRRHASNMSNAYNIKHYNAFLHTINKWKDMEGYQQSLATIQLSAINNFTRDHKQKALIIILSNVQYANKWLYWRGVLKLLIPGFVYKRLASKT